MRKLIGTFTLVLIALGLLASSASAAWNIDSGGYGFVGKGDVQTVLGLNNAQMQAQATSLRFTYESSDVYSVTVEWTTGEGTKGERTHTVEHKRTVSVNDTVSYDARKANQVNGFNLTGFGGTSENVSIPQIGAPWSNGDGNEATITSVELISSSGGILKVNGTALLPPAI